MHFRLIIVICCFPILANALKNVEEFFKISQRYRQEVAPGTAYEKKFEKLQKLEKEIAKTLDDYEKASPQEGGQDEEFVAKFSYSLEPVLELKAPQTSSNNGCEKARHQIEFKDKGSRREDAPLTKEAQEALAWLTLLCQSK